MEQFWLIAISVVVGWLLGCWGSRDTGTHWYPAADTEPPPPPKAPPSVEEIRRQWEAMYRKPRHEPRILNGYQPEMPAGIEPLPPPRTR